MGADDQNRKWPKIVLILVLVLFVVLAVLGRMVGPDDAGPESPASTSVAITVTIPPDPPDEAGADNEDETPESAPVPHGTPGSASAVATEWTETVARLVYETSADARADLTVLSSSEVVVADELEDLKLRQENVLDADDEALIWSQFAPLGVKETGADDRVTVEVWGVWVQAADPVVAPVAAWTIWAVDLERAGDGWTVVGSDRGEGPAFGLSLSTVPTDGPSLPSELGGFEPVGVR